MANFQEDGDLQNTVKISARRFEESPFISRIDDTKMIRGVYAGRYLAIYNGEDVAQKYWTLRKKALIYDVPEKPIEISCPDALPFLDKVLTRDITKLEEWQRPLRFSMHTSRRHFYGWCFVQTRR